MLRIMRRYRFLILALFVTFAVYKFKHLRDLAPDLQTASYDFSSAKEGGAGPQPVERIVFNSDPQVPLENEKLDKDVKSPVVLEEVFDEQVPPTSTTTTPDNTDPSVPQILLPDKQKPPPTYDYGDEFEDIHPIGQPGRQDFPAFEAAPTTIHWSKQVEHFPVPTESIIHLPKGKPIQIPRIQHDFDDETMDIKLEREQRQLKVKQEFQKAWVGYKGNAWMHDELSPVSGNFRDPFCGWAATLVDALDTLWIMGLKDEFDEAAKAVSLIDFTTSPRGDIPVFETTIRYLGGLLAAYDVSGGQYKNLLDKATELGDILLGAFDTPNRMPDLYYRWKPAFASQPHRASQRSNTAEIGSLSMEFTRLAQLTQEPRYYDAIARVTDALSDWQDRGTKLAGVFPEDVDASGCNRTVVANQIPDTVSIGRGPAMNAGKTTKDRDPMGYEPSDVQAVAEPRPKKKVVASDASKIETQILPVGPETEPFKAQILGWEDNHKGIQNKKITQRDLSEQERPPDDTVSTNDVGRDATVPRDDVTSRPGTPSTQDNFPDDPIAFSAAEARVAATAGEWDCVKQGLEPAAPNSINKFSMGGGQDSTYEYMPKQYILLGGLEEKYGKMYLKTIEAIRKWMLYRPMVPGDHDILFSGAVRTNGDPENDLNLEAELEHLTCFIGGMVGMGAKIFGIEADLEIAKKLTDGCVWAYGQTPSGIMPEGSHMAPCASMKHCTWNETEYWQYLDPIGPRRDQMVEEYVATKAAQKIAASSRAGTGKPSGVEAEVDATTDGNGPQIQNEIPKGSDIYDSGSHVADTSLDQSSSQKFEGAQSNPLQTRQLPEGLPKNANSPHISNGLRDGLPSISQSRNPQTGSQQPPANTQAFPHDDVARLNTLDIKDRDTVANELPAKSKPLSQLEAGTDSLPDNDIPASTKENQGFDEKSKLTDMPSGNQADAPVVETPTYDAETLPDPMKPLSHKEWVDAHIEREALPPGFVSIRSRRYILRPEAIESVWYMYRITGDKSWQDKGWKMFESVIKATSSKHGHSAIYDVTLPTSYRMDEMESFWLAETLKYFFLLFSTPDTVSLDDWVLNTEAHPFKRPS